MTKVTSKGSNAMSDISASERRLSAALDRIDKLLEHESRAVAPTWPDSGLQSALESAQKENQQLKIQIAALSAASPENGSDAIERLVAANAGLAAANRTMINTASGQDDAVAAVRHAFEQEIESLHAAHFAEAEQLQAIMTELERLLTVTEAPDDEEDRADDIAPFSNVYRDTPENDDETTDEER